MSIRSFSRRLGLLSLVCMLVGCGSEPDTAPTPQPFGLSRKSNSEREQSDPYIEESIPVHIGIITAGSDPYSNMLASGCRDAASELNVELELGTPEGGSVDRQDELCREVSRKGITGIAVNPIDPDAQVQTLNRLNRMIETLTFGTDSPDSERQIHVGVDDYQIGRDCAQVTASLFPDGCNVVLIADRLDGASASLRRQGLIDAVLNRDRDAERYRSGEEDWDADGEPIAGDKITVIDTLIDDGAENSASSQLQVLFSAGTDIDAIIGLRGDCVPQCLSSINTAEIPEGIKWIGLGYDAALVECIQEGRCHSAIIADPYPLGKEAVRVLKDVVQLQRSKLPDNGFATTPAIEVTQDNIEMLLSQWQAAAAAKSNAGR